MPLLLEPEGMASPPMIFAVRRPNERSPRTTPLEPCGADASEGMKPASPPFRIPLYMYCLDLAFTAAFNVCAACLRLSRHEEGSDTLVRYWATYLPIAWIWDHTNRFFNRFDQGDLVSEIVVLVLMGLVMAYTLNTKTCFFADLLQHNSLITPWPAFVEGGGDTDGGRAFPAPPRPEVEAHLPYMAATSEHTMHAPPFVAAPYAAPPSVAPATPTVITHEQSCTYIAAAYGGARLLTTILTAYGALFGVRLAKRLLARELVIWLILAPLLVLLASPYQIPILEDGYNEVRALLDLT